MSFSSAPLSLDHHRVVELVSRVAIMVQKLEDRLVGIVNAHVSPQSALVREIGGSIATSKVALLCAQARRLEQIVPQMTKTDARDLCGVLAGALGPALSEI